MRYALDPAMPVLLRPDGTVQVGWDPRRAVRVRPPAGLSPGGLAAVLRAMSTPRTPADLAALAGDASLVGELVAAGVLRACAGTGGRTLSIRVHGGGPLSDLLAEGLRCSGARVSRTRHANATGAPAGVDLVVLTDALAPDSRLVRDLQLYRVAHLPVRLRDGAGVVGPLVIPGRTSCLVCADLHRTDRDPAWPALAAQLREITGVADRPTVLATAAVALAQVQQVIAGVRGTATPPPATLNATVEVDLGARRILARRWARHPLCGCWTPPPGPGAPGSAPRR